jgi:acetoin utilization deacetylase AcuC-like enzyme
VLITSQYEINEILQKIKNKSSFELKDNERSRPSSLRVIISKLYYSLDYEKEPQASREKVTQLLLYHGQFSLEEIEEIFQSSAKETTSYSIEFLKQHPEVAKAEALKSKEFPDEIECEGVEKPMEIKYIFPHYR